MQASSILSGVAFVSKLVLASTANRAGLGLKYNRHAYQMVLDIWLKWVAYAV
jgi:hypothetical protein